MKKLKILLLIDTLELGGAQTHLITLYNSLTEAGHNVYVVSNGGILSKNIRHKKINLVSHSPITLLKSFFALLSFIKREKFDILHAHARICALFAHLISRFCSIPFICTAHAHFKVGFLRKKLSFWGDKTIAVSEDLRLYLTKNYHVFPENISVIENGLDTSLFSPSQNKNPYHIIFLSRLFVMRKSIMQHRALFICALSSTANYNRWWRKGFFRGTFLCRAFKPSYRRKNPASCR